MEQPVEKLLTIIESISDGVFTVDLDFKIDFINKAALNMVGIKTGDAIGQKCNEIFRTNICKNQCALEQTMKSGKSIVNRSVCMKNRKGKKIPISISTAILKNKIGHIVGGVETIRDLSLVETLRNELESSYTFENIIGHNQRMRELFKIMPEIAKSDSTVLIEGESGVGKELFARALHSLSERRDKPMISVNCAALTETLIESELFGYKAGAFTGALRDKKGRFALAEGGTLFLDEIGDFSPALQVKLLRVLQDHIYEPIGGTESLKADIRIISATNKDLDELVKNGQFREDLYYRINVMRIKIPPLRERKEDIPLFIDYIIEKLDRLHKRHISCVEPNALQIIMKHNFPGNVRELENIFEHASILCENGVVKQEHLPDYLYRDHPIPMVEIASTMEEMEALFITAALKKNNWNRNETAKELGFTPTTLYRKIKKLKLNLPLQDGRFKKK